MSFITADEIRTIAVIGAGTMGHGIAQVCAQIGASVRLYDALQGGARAGIGRIQKNLDKGVELGKLTADERATILGRLEPFDALTPTCEACSRPSNCSINLLSDSVFSWSFFDETSSEANASFIGTIRYLVASL